MNAKIYMYTAGLFLTFAASGCSNESLPSNEEEQALPIEGILLSMGQAEASNNDAATRATTINGYSVNVVGKDPTKVDLATVRKDWLLDFALYNGENKYATGSFEEGTYNKANEYWIKTGTTYYFPNYLSPGAELMLYPDAKKADKNAITDNQATTSLLQQDVLMQKNNSNGTHPLITPAHIVIKGKTDTKTEGIHMVHKHAMLDFIISDINTADIAEVKVEVTTKENPSVTTKYTPYEITGLTGKKEYMLILPEATDTDPVVTVTTNSGSEVDAIRYRQTVKIISTKYPQLGTNNCFCFTLKGKALELSPITIVDWARGEAIQGEYIAVTAYPTFKAKENKNQTFYFYYDNKLTESNGSNGMKAKLQKITFNQDGECTIKPDGRIITHIFKDNATDKTPSEKNELATPITLGAMVIDLTNIIKDLK